MTDFLYLDDAIKNINKKYKEEIITIGPKPFLGERISFSSPALNYLTYGGIPRGRVIEIFGREHSGKTTIGYDLIGNFQAIYNEQKAVYFDLEAQFDESWCKKFKVDINDLIFYDPEGQSAEQIFDDIVILCNSKDIGLIVLDSVPTLIPNDDISKDNIDNSKVGGIAKPLRRFLSKNLGNFKHNNLSLILINQNIDVINSRFPMQTTPGGGALKYYASLRLECRKGDSYFDIEGNKVASNFSSKGGHSIQVCKKKSKCGKMDRELAEMTLMYETGIDVFRDCISLGVDFGLIEEPSKSYYIIGDSVKLHGEKQAANYLRDNTNKFIEIYTKLNDINKV